LPSAFNQTLIRNGLDCLFRTSRLVTHLLEITPFHLFGGKVGVDTRNFNRTLGRLTRRGLFETVRHGHAYRLSPHGLAAVEQQIA